jgi:1-acyl-sn-glycerol-3-phosphate acyltransferase
MKFFREIAGRVWALWGLVSFAVTFLIIFLPSMLSYLFPEPKGTVVLMRIAKVWMDVWLFLVGCPVKVKGKENFAPGKSYVVTCNHNSLLDVPLSSPYVPGANKTIAKKSFAKVPLFGWFYAKGSVLVDRKSERSRRKSFDEMKAVLRMGLHMCIYPEGTRNRGNEPLKKFYDGAFRLSKDTGHAVMPALIFNTRKALPANKPFFFLPYRLRMEFLPPVEPEGLTTEELRESVFQKMKTYYEENE